MNHLKHFIQMVQEGVKFDDQDVKNMTLELNDLGAEVEIRKGFFNLSYFDRDRFMGSYQFPEAPINKDDSPAYLIVIKTEHLNYVTNQQYGVITDSRIYEILGVICEIAGRTENCYFSTYQNPHDGIGSFRFLLYILTKENIGGSDEEFFIKGLYSMMQSAMYKCKSDFCNGLTSKLDGNKIILHAGPEYTDRKFFTLFGVIFKSVNWENTCSIDIKNNLTKGKPTIYEPKGAIRGDVDITITYKK